MLLRQSNLAPGFSSDKFHPIRVSTLTLYGIVSRRRVCCEQTVTRSHPLQCNSARYTSTLKYQGESHHSLLSIDLAPNLTLKIG